MAMGRLAEAKLSGAKDGMYPCQACGKTGVGNHGHEYFKQRRTVSSANHGKARRTDVESDCCDEEGAEDWDTIDSIELSILL